ncbi:hypothetical protein SDC9_192175 [bioreactor metagenome]|uniref:Uncharacterized protein n=1 Tax=bioreactor metagenome TaxID=1076179 RepID=A0A645I0B7_9ZZZZ
MISWGILLLGCTVVANIVLGTYYKAWGIGQGFSKTKFIKGIRRATSVMVAVYLLTFVGTSFPYIFADYMKAGDSVTEILNAVSFYAIMIIFAVAIGIYFIKTLDNLRGIFGISANKEPDK